MSMSRKHYREVAAILKAERFSQADEDTFDDALGANSVLDNVARGLATMFQIDNRNFDRDKFLEACGIK